VVKAAFALSTPQQLSEIISTPRGFYLLKLTERYPATVRSLPLATSEIVSKLKREKMARAQEAFARKIKLDKRIELRRDRLAAIPAPPPERARKEDEPSVPPALPNR
jgi:parvulin-like peptidyl-prolyl isomerase